MQYGSPTLSTPSSTREQQSMTMNFSTSTPESSSNVPNGYHTEKSLRLNVHSPVITRQAPIPSPSPPPPPLLSQFESTNHMLHYPMMKQIIARPSASPPPPPPPPPPSAPALPV